MVGNRTLQRTILGGGLVVLLGILGCQQPPSPDELAQKALNAADPEEQESAAVELAAVANNEELEPQLREKAKIGLRKVLAESQSPPVQAACLQGLSSQWDYESMPAFLDALDHESDLIRSRAVATVERMMSVDLGGFGYRYTDPPAIRAAAIQRIRQDWEKKRDQPVFIKWRERLKEKHQQS
ncbi:MAG: HEAT repeat domain-containing protein [Planctomycetota bacterium]|jgi:hypothetical protein